MIYVLSFFGFFMVLMVSIVAAETYAMTYPKDNFSKWWRKYIIQDQNRI